MKTWTLAEAEQDFKKIFDLAVEGESQMILLPDGEQRAVVLIRLDLYEAMQGRATSNQKPADDGDNE